MNDRDRRLMEIAMDALSPFADDKSLDGLDAMEAREKLIERLEEPEEGTDHEED